jgi:putative SOS response-associated peptidase YedK
MCNLFTQTHVTEAMQRLFGDRLAVASAAQEAAVPGDIYPDGRAVLIRPAGEGEAPGLVLDRGRWGMPTPAVYLEGRRTDRGVTNVRNTGSAHWRRWLGPEHRCLVPFARFAEPGPGGVPVWFSTADGGPAFLAGITTVWTSVRRLREGETTDRLFAFLTCPPNAEVAAVHPKAMPVILTRPDEWETWLGAPWPIAALMQRPLADGLLRAGRAPA